MNGRILRGNGVKLSWIVCIACVLGGSSRASALTKHYAYAVVENRTGQTIEWVTLLHHYSSNISNHATWVNLHNNAQTKGPQHYNKTRSGLAVRYHTGFLTTGKDWWMIMWKFTGKDTVYVSEGSPYRAFIDLGERIAPFILGELTSEAITAIGALGGPIGEVIGSVLGNYASDALADALFNDFQTDGWKQYMLEGADANELVKFTITDKGITIYSPSGSGATRFAVLSKGAKKKDKFSVHGEFVSANYDQKNNATLLTVKLPRGSSSAARNKTPINKSVSVPDGTTIVTFHEKGLPVRTFAGLGSFKDVKSGVDVRGMLDKGDLGKVIRVNIKGKGEKHTRFARAYKLGGSIIKLLDEDPNGPVTRVALSFSTGTGGKNEHRTFCINASTKFAVTQELLPEGIIEHSTKAPADTKPCRLEDFVEGWSDDIIQINGIPFRCIVEYTVGILDTAPDGTATRIIYSTNRTDGKQNK